MLDSNVLENSVTSFLQSNQIFGLKDPRHERTGSNKNINVFRSPHVMEHPISTPANQNFNESATFDQGSDAIVRLHGSLGRSFPCPLGEVSAKLGARRSSPPTSGFSFPMLTSFSCEGPGQLERPAGIFLPATQRCSKAIACNHVHAQVKVVLPRARCFLSLQWQPRLAIITSTLKAGVMPSAALHFSAFKRRSAVYVV